LKEKDLSKIFPYEEIKDLKEWSIPKMEYNSLEEIIEVESNESGFSKNKLSTSVMVEMLKK